MDRRSLLAASHLFEGLDPGIIDRLNGIAATRRLAPGEALFFKGDEGDAFYGVMKGKVRISTTAPSGKEVVLSMMQSGDVFGEIALLDGMPRTADALAVEASELLAIHRRDFSQFVAREPSLALHLLSLLSRRLRQTNERIEDIAFLSLSGRLAKCLIGMAQHAESRGEGAGGIKISQSELANFLATSRESVNKHLQVWRKNGWIELARSRVFVRQPQALMDVVDSGFDE